MEKSFCFNSINGDRKYKAEDFREYFATFIGNGIFPNPSTNLQCIGENGDMTVTLKTGNGWINGALYVNDNDLILPIDVADGVLNRIDRIVLRMDTVGRAINAVVKKGAFASSPVAPELQRDADAYELGVADIYVAAGATQITQANITDLRLNSSICGIVHGTVDQVDTTTLFNQYLSWLNQKKTQYNTDILNWTAQKQADFNTWYNNITSASQQDIDDMEAQFQQDWNNWFATVQNVLDGDTAGNLLNLINQNTSSITNLVEEVNTHKADYMYQIPNITGTQIRINRLSNTNRLFFKLSSDLTGGAITISTDGGTTEKPLQDVDGTAITVLEKGFVEVVADANFFILRNRGISTSQKQALIDITNVAEANERTIKTNIANALNSVSVLQSLGLNSSSSWMNILNAIPSIKTGRKLASGTATASSTTQSFTADNGTTLSTNYVTTTGLTFTPSIIIVNGRFNSTNPVTILSNKQLVGTTNTDAKIGFNGGAYRLISPASIYNGGAVLPVNSTGTQDWIAIE